MIIAYRNGNPVRLDEVAHVYDGIENDKTGQPGTRASATIYLAIQKQPGTNVVAGRRRGQGAAADVPRAAAAVGDRSTSAPIARSPSASRSHDVKFTLLLTIGLVVAGDLPVPAERLGDDHPQPGAAGVDRRDLRGDVPARLQPRQPVADGADALGRLRRRRRDRDAGEHRPAHGDGQAADAGGVRRLEGDRLHDRLDDAVAGRGVHPGALHGRHRRPAAARVRGDDRRRDSGVGLRVDQPDADAVQPLPEAAARAEARLVLQRDRADVRRVAAGSTTGRCG